VAAPDPLTQLEAQRAHFASDRHVYDEVAIWADATPEQRLAELASMSAANDAMLARIDEATLERMRALRAPGPDVVQLLETLAKANR
jgi:hypothetical protein